MLLVDLTANPDITVAGGESGLIYNQFYSENCFQIDDQDTTGFQKAFGNWFLGMHASMLFVQWLLRCWNW